LVIYIGKPTSKHELAQVIPRLGSCPDSELADEIGCDVSLLSKLRRKLHIVRYDRMKGTAHLLGRMSDHELARRMRGKVTRQTIRLHRLRLGIPAFDDRRAPARTTVERCVSQFKEQLEA
jgi:hypothetical protein